MKKGKEKEKLNNAIIHQNLPTKTDFCSSEIQATRAFLYLVGQMIFLCYRFFYLFTNGIKAMLVFVFFSLFKTHCH
jgi:hypothetical protein